MNDAPLAKEAGKSDAKGEEKKKEDADSPDIEAKENIEELGSGHNFPKALHGNIFTNTDIIAKRLRNMLFSTRKAVSTFGKIFNKEREHCAWTLGRLRTLDREKKVPPKRSRSQSEILKNPKLEAAEQRPRGLSVDDTDSTKWSLEKLGVTDIWQEMVQVSIQQTIDRDVAAKAVIVKALNPLRRFLTKCVNSYNIGVKRHAKCSRLLRDLRVDLKDRKARVIQLLHQCERERRIAAGQPAPQSNSLLGRLAGGMTRLVLGGMERLQQQAITETKAYRNTLKKLNMEAEIAIKTTLPSVCEAYRNVGLSMNSALAAHLNVLGSLSARSSSTIALAAKTLEAKLSELGPALEATTKEVLRSEPDNEALMKRLFKYDLPVTLDQIQKGVFYKPPPPSGKEVPIVKPKIEREVSFGIACYILGMSNILSELEMKKLVSKLPNRFHMRDWTRLYALQKDGASLETFLKRVKYHRGKLLILRDSHGNKFGFFTPDMLISSEAYYGGRETCVFKVVYGSEDNKDREKSSTDAKDSDSSTKKNEKSSKKEDKSSEKKDEKLSEKKDVKKPEGEIVVWNWSGKSDCLLLIRDNNLSVGADEPALHLDSHLANGTSGICKTFSSPALSNSEFVIHDAEGWGEVE